MDNGLIKVKKFLKRSPQTIEIYEPLYNFSVPQWFHNNHCFFHAKEGNRFGIYQTDLDGQVSAIIKSPLYDYLYPQKIGDSIFFVARDLVGNYSVKKTNYYATQLSDVQNVQNFEQRNLINLCMINQDEGFAIEHVSTNDMQLTFNVYHFTMHDKKMIFSFYLPSSFFTDKTIMLRDPLAALFPRFTFDKIYFISSFAKASDFVKTSSDKSADRSCYKNEYTMQHYYYDLKTNEVIVCDAYNYFPVPNNVFSDNYQHILMSMMTQNGLLSGFAWE